MDYSTFSLDQQITFTNIKNLNEQLQQKLEPGLFVLNNEIVKIYDQIAEERLHCKHIYENGVCAVCGKEEK